MVGEGRVLDLERLPADIKIDGSCSCCTLGRYIEGPLRQHRAAGIGIASVAQGQRAGADLLQNGTVPPPVSSTAPLTFVERLLKPTRSLPPASVGSS